MGRVMKFKDLFGPYAAYVKKNETLACFETGLPAFGGHRGVRPGVPDAGRGGRARPELARSAA
jgi:hypothetical protein